MKVWTPRKKTNEAHLSTEQSAAQTDARFPRAHGEPGRAQGPETPARQGSQAADRQHPAEAGPLIRPAGGAGSQRFPRAHRIRKRPEFLSLQRDGRRRTVPHFVVITRLRKAPPSRLGITTSRKIGSAPARNRVRRLVREFFRRHEALLARDCDVLVVARPGAADLDYANVKRQLSTALAIGADV